MLRGGTEGARGLPVEKNLNVITSLHSNNFTYLPFCIRSPARRSRSSTKREQTYCCSLYLFIFNLPPEYRCIHVYFLCLGEGIRGRPTACVLRTLRCRLDLVLFTFRGRGTDANDVSSQQLAINWPGVSGLKLT